MRVPLLVLVLMAPLVVPCQPVLFQRITERDGLVFGEVQDLCFDAQGWLWVGTSMGLSRYDGSRFRTYTKADGLPAPRVHDIELDSTGMLWLATANGLARLDPRTDSVRTWRLDLDEQDPTNRNHFVGVRPLRDGTVIGAAQVGTYVLDTRTGTFRALKGRNDQQLQVYGATMLVEGKGAGCWLGTVQEGLLYYDAAQGRLLTEGDVPEVLPLMRGKRVSSLMRDEQGRYWTDDLTDGGMNVCDPQRNTWRHWPGIPGHPRRQFREGLLTLAHDGRGRIWLSDWTLNPCILDTRDSSLVELMADHTDPATLPQGTITAVAVDAAGRTWVGTLNGLVVHDPGRFAFERMVIAGREGAPADGVNGMTEDALGRVWAVAWPDLVRLDDHGRVLERHVLRVHGEVVKALDVAAAGDALWVSTSAGLVRFDPQTARQALVAEIPTPTDPNLGRIQADGRGRLWCRRVLGDVVRFDPVHGSFRRYPRDRTMAAGPPPGKLFDMVLGSDGGIHLASEDHGLVRMDTATGRCTSNLGAIRAGRVEGTRILAVAEDAHGIIWYVADGTGLVRFDPRTDRYTVYDARHGLPIPSAAGLVVDRSGRLWLGMLNGLVRFEPERERFVPVDVYRGQAQNDVARTWLLRRNGELWMTQFHELIRFDPDHLAQASAPPPPMITELWSQGVPLPLPGAAALQLDPDQDQLSLRYASFAPPGGIVRYAMRSISDSSWTESDEGEVMLRDLPIGTHRYQFRTRSTDGHWSLPTTLLVHRTPPWWQTLGARIGFALLLAAAIVLAFRMRLNWIRRRERRQEAMERTMNELKLQALRAQMDPHFIFNCLNSIDKYILMEEGEKASRHLNRFARLVRLILNQSDRMTTPVEQEAEMLRYYLELEALRFKHPFTWDVKVDPELLLAEAELPTLLVQPYVENAIWHGLQHKEGAGRITVEFRRTGRELECIIEDDGIGREASARINAERRGAHQSKAMRLNADRLRIFEETHAGGVRAEVIDLKDRVGAPLGTRVRLLLPIESLEDQHRSA